LNVTTLAIDVGGTFTDVLLRDAAGGLVSCKLPSDASDPEAAMADALAALGEGERRFDLLYSTTAALNAVLTGTLPRIGLVVTAGFRDLLETARFAPAGRETPTPRRLVALEYVREIGARVDASGSVTAALDPSAVERIAGEFSALGIEVVAVVLLHSYRNPVHEDAVHDLFGASAPQITVVRSSRVMAEQNEYSRALATCLNTALVPVLGRHLDALAARAACRARTICLMQASGGLASARRARAQPLATAMSGPAAAVIGMRAIGHAAGYQDFVTLDIGGTSTDIAVVRGSELPLTTAGLIGGFTVGVPMIDVQSIGAGGGSLARTAPDGRWHVGPESAGARPGPACYGRGGTAATLTDAGLVLGRLPEALLGGALPLDRNAAVAALARFGRSRGLDPHATARGLLEIASYAMCGAIRRACVLGGHDPTSLALLAMGGGGPLHGAELAGLLGIRTVIVPPQPGLAAPWGLLLADLTIDLVKSMGRAAEDIEPGACADGFASLEAEAAARLADEGVPLAGHAFERALDLRYAGMAHAVTEPCVSGGCGEVQLRATLETFHRRFERLSGHRHREREAVELVNLRLRARGRLAERRPAEVPRPGAAARAVGASRDILFLGQKVPIAAAVHDRIALAPDARITGPATIEQYESTTIVPPGWHTHGDAFGNLILRPYGG
jgi:N-methylhydantoinase A